MNSDSAKQTLDSFLEDEISVLTLKGDWGIGKTYFWEQYVKEKIYEKKIGQVAYSYVSLFGLRDLNELKVQIFQNGRPLLSNKEMNAKFTEFGAEENQLLKYAPWTSSLWRSIEKYAPFLSKFFQTGKMLPASKTFETLISFFEYGLIRNYLICFDDLERKANNLSLKEVMGLIDQLSKRKGCKIILIFDEMSLKEQDKDDFETYREKVVDWEIEYRPSIRENLLHVFSDSDANFASILNAFQILNAYNIRIFKKLKWAIGKLPPCYSVCDFLVQQEITLRLGVFCWGFYNPKEKLKFDFIRKSISQSLWLSSPLQPAENTSDEEKEWNEIANTLGLFPKVYDDSLISLFEKGYVDSKKLTLEIEKENVEARQRYVSSNLHRIWNIYTDSFEDNFAEFRDSIEQFASSNIERISFWDFSNIIDILEEFGENVDSLVTAYLNQHQDELSALGVDLASSDRSIKNQQLKNAIFDAQQHSKRYSLDDVLQKIVRNEGWDLDEVNYLSSLSEDDIYEWMKSNPNLIILKIKRGLLFFDNLKSNKDEETQKYEIIAANTKKAMKKIADENFFNKHRVQKIYGLN